MRRAFLVIAFIMVSSLPGNAWHRQERLLAEIGQSATPENITKVIAGKTCTGSDNDVLKFGASASGKPGEFAHSGWTLAKYQVRYAAVFIVRDGEMHSHVITVSPGEGLLHFNGRYYKC